MNMVLHGIGDIAGEVPVSSADALVASPSRTYHLVLADPPFGRKSALSFTIDEDEKADEDLTYKRQDFWATTSNKQLDVFQHVRSMLKSTGRAAVALPDNVLFEGGAGETIRRRLLAATELHAILRLPTGLFYRPGVKANVLFFDNRPASPEPQTLDVRYCDYRTNLHHTLKRKPMTFADLEGFVRLYNPANRIERQATWDAEANPEGRWRSCGRDELLARDRASLDVFWPTDCSLTDLDNPRDPEVLAEEAVENLETGLASLRRVLTGLKASAFARQQWTSRPSGAS